MLVTPLLAGGEGRRGRRVHLGAGAGCHRRGGRGQRLGRGGHRPSGLLEGTHEVRAWRCSGGRVWPTRLRDRGGAGTACAWLGGAECSLCPYTARRGSFVPGHQGLPQPPCPTNPSPLRPGLRQKPWRPRSTPMGPIPGRSSASRTSQRSWQAAPRWAEGAGVGRTGGRKQAGNVAYRQRST